MFNAMTVRIAEDRSPQRLYQLDVEGEREIFLHEPLESQIIELHSSFIHHFIDFA